MGCPQAGQHSRSVQASVTSFRSLCPVGSYHFRPAFSMLCSVGTTSVPLYTGKGERTMSLAMDSDLFQLLTVMSFLMFVSWVAYCHSIYKR